MMKERFLCPKKAWRRGLGNPLCLLHPLSWSRVEYRLQQTRQLSSRKPFMLSVVVTRISLSGAKRSDIVVIDEFIFIFYSCWSFIHCSNCYKQIGWIYGSVTEDILTGFKMHARGWISIYCMPLRPAFKGSAPINLSDRLNQVLRWALGSIEILLSRHCPIWYGYSGRLKLLERLAYINTIVYPLTSIPLIAYCVLPAICLLTGKFIIPEVSYRS